MHTRGIIEDNVNILAALVLITPTTITGASLLGAEIIIFWPLKRYSSVHFWSQSCMLISNCHVLRYFYLQLYALSEVARFLSTLSLLSVNVPVLSLQRTSIPAISSMAVILLVIAPCCASLCDPIAIVTERTIGMAMGIPPIRSTRRLSTIWRYFLSWIAYITMNSIVYVREEHFLIKTLTANLSSNAKRNMHNKIFQWKTVKKIILWFSYCQPWQWKKYCHMRFEVHISKNLNSNCGWKKGS